MLCGRYKKGHLQKTFWQGWNWFILISNVNALWRKKNHRLPAIPIKNAPTLHITVNTSSLTVGQTKTKIIFIITKVKEK